MVLIDAKKNIFPSKWLIMILFCWYREGFFSEQKACIAVFVDFLWIIDGPRNLTLEDNYVLKTK